MKSVTKANEQASNNLKEERNNNKKVFESYFFSTYMCRTHINVCNRKSTLEQKLLVYIFFPSTTYSIQTSETLLRKNLCLSFVR